MTVTYWNQHFWMVHWVPVNLLGVGDYVRHAKLDFIWFLKYRVPPIFSIEIQWFQWLNTSFFPIQWPFGEHFRHSDTPKFRHSALSYCWLFIPAMNIPFNHHSQPLNPQVYRFTSWKIPVIPVFRDDVTPFFFIQFWIIFPDSLMNDEIHHFHEFYGVYHMPWNS